MGAKTIKARMMWTRKEHAKEGRKGDEEAGGKEM